MEAAGRRRGLTGDDDADGGEFDSPRQFLDELDGFYRKTAAAGRPGRAGGADFEKPWRFQRRLTSALGDTRDRELQKLRTHLINEILGKGAAQVKLRPPGAWRSSGPDC